MIAPMRTALFCLTCRAPVDFVVFSLRLRITGLHTCTATVPFSTLKLLTGVCSLSFWHLPVYDRTDRVALFSL